MENDSINGGHGHNMGGFDRPKRFGVCFVKNEEDIIADSVAHAARFCDRLFVVDNATTDQTWDIVNGLELDSLVRVFSKDFVFRDYLRLRFMDAKKEELRLNNWWYLFDADQLLLDDPLDAIVQPEKEGAGCIAIQVINFFLTKEEIRGLEENDRQETWRDRTHYVLYESGPVKFFKNTRYVDYRICELRALCAGLPLKDVRIKGADLSHAINNFFLAKPYWRLRNLMIHGGLGGKGDPFEIPPWLRIPKIEGLLSEYFGYSLAPIATRLE